MADGEVGTLTKELPEKDPDLLISEKQKQTSDLKG